MAPSPTQLTITISFDVDQQQWTHEFKVSKNSTILQLKETMLGAGAGKEDVDAFELQRSGGRVHDGEPLAREQTLSFAYLGQEEGSRRAQSDKASPAPEAFREKEEDVEVTVRHSDPSKGEVRVTVRSTATIRDVRRAVMGAVGEARLSEVKLVSQSQSQLADDDKIGSSRLFLSAGRALSETTDPPPSPEKPAEVLAEATEPPPAPEKPAEDLAEAAPVLETPATAEPEAEPPARVPEGLWTVTVTIDRSLGLQMPVEVSGGDTVRNLKEKLAAEDPTGTTTASSISLCTSPPEGSETGGPPLADETVLTERHMYLDLTPADL